MSSIRVLVVEDEPLIAEDIRETLDNIDFEVSGVAYDSDVALQQLATNTPDIVLLDVNLGSELDGIDIAQLINKKYQIPFIYLTSYADRGTVDRAKHTRPMGYIVKPFDERDLFTTLEIALHNYSQSQPKIELDINVLNGKLLGKLTQKEFEILKSIFDGKTNRQMAEEHFISLNTIKTHVKNLYDKLDVHTRTQAIAKLREMSAYHSG
ncbi:MAG: response regulator transcription factor [Saprospiraceae bacterium]|nr:response regulator transcription factor [Saprospiraceae bacterium]